ncbi:MAG: DUF1398 family protein [Polyangiaceae bacterium]
MDQQLQQFIEESLAASHAGTRSFGEIVVRLAQHGVESYRVDYRDGSATYFLPSGDSYRASLRVPELAIGERFDAPAVVEAIVGSQQGRVKYPEFIERSMRAGCVTYTVWISGRQVTYFGRNGESHVERFLS